MSGFVKLYYFRGYMSVDKGMIEVMLRHLSALTEASVTQMAGLLQVHHMG